MLVDSELGTHKVLHHEEYDVHVKELFFLPLGSTEGNFLMFANKLLYLPLSFLVHSST